MSSRSREHVTAEQLRQRFRSHLARNAGISALAVAISLAVGMAGYHWLAPMPWLDAFVNASMLLSGMGPVTPLSGPEISRGLKMFAGAYAIYCGVVFIATMGLVVAPIATHVLHRFHMDRD